MNDCPSDSKPRHRPRLAGIWEGGFTPGTPVSTQSQKMSKRHKYRKETFSSVVFPGHSGFHPKSKDVKKTQISKRNFFFGGFPRALRFPPKVKRCQKDTNIEKKLFLRWFS